MKNRKYHLIIYLFILNIFLCCSNQLYINQNGYGPIKVGMRIDIAYQKIDKKIEPKDALTENDMKCFYAFIENTSDSLMLTVKNSHILRFDCDSKLISTDEDIRVGDTVQKVLINYGSMIKKRELHYLENSEYSLSVIDKTTELIFIIQNDAVKKIIVGDLSIMNQQEGCSQ